MVKYSEGFIGIFSFFLKSYRVGLLNFCGSQIDVTFDKDGFDGKFTFRKFEDGFFKNKNLSSKHPNIVKGVVVGKKSWGLWLNEWTDGIVEGSFTVDEILNEFKDKGIKIPTPFLKDFTNTIIKKTKRKIKNGKE